MNFHNLFDNLRRFKKQLLIVLPVFILIILGFTFLNSPGKSEHITSLPQPSVIPTRLPTVQYPSVNTGTKYPFNIKQFDAGYSVGNVKIFTKDLDYKYTLYFKEPADKRNDLTKWQQVADMVLKDAILQNEGAKAGLYPATEKLTPNLINKAEEYFRTNGTSYISFEEISLWFYNTNPPSLGVEAAKNKLLPVIKQLRDDIVNNRITMEQAGSKISGMADLETIDPSYKTNAYSEFPQQKLPLKVFNDPSLNQSIEKLDTGTISDVLTGHDYNGKNPYEAYYTIVKVTDKKILPDNTFEDFIRNKIKEYGFIELSKLN